MADVPNVTDKAVGEQMIEGIIFDVDGTILDSMEIWMNVGKRYLESLGTQAEDNLGEVLFSLTMKEGAEYIKNNYALDFSVEEIIEGINDTVYRFYAREAQPKHGIEQFLQWASEQKIPMTIATSTDRPLIEAAFTRLGLSDYFGKIFTTTEIGKGKGEPDIYIAAQQYMKSSRENTWLIDDALYALETAKECGFQTVGVYDSSSEKEQEKIVETADVYIRGWDAYETLIKEMGRE